MLLRNTVDAAERRRRHREHTVNGTEPNGAPRCTVCGTPVARHGRSLPAVRSLTSRPGCLARGGLWAVALLIVVCWAAALAVIAGAR